MAEMTDMEMDLVIAQAEIKSLKQTVIEQSDQIENQKTHIASLQRIIEKQRNLLESAQKTDGDSSG